MTNKQLQILADRIYKKLSEDKRYEQLAEEKVKEFKPLLEELTDLEKIDNEISNRINSIRDQLRKNISTDYYIYSFEESHIKKYIKQMLLPSKQTIEEELILAGSGNVEDLMNLVIEKLTK